MGWGAVGVLAFSMSLPATRLAVLGGLDGFVVGLGRTVVGAALAAGYLAWRRVPRPARADWPRLVSVALGIVFGFPLLTALALAQVPASHGIIATGLLPAATAVVAVLRAGERPSALFWVASLAGFGCVAVFALTRGAGEASGADLLLLAAIAAAAVGYAEGGALARTMGGAAVISWALVISAPLALGCVVPFLDWPALTAVRAPAWTGFAYLCVVSAFLGFFAWYRGLALGGVARVGQIQLVQPLLALLWAALILGEALTWQNLVAALAVLACVVGTQVAR